MPYEISFKKRLTVTLSDEYINESPLPLRSSASTRITCEVSKRTSVSLRCRTWRRVALPEDLIIYKATAWRDRDRSDIERLLVLHPPEIDIEPVRGLITEIGSALDDPNRISLFDQLVVRARAAQ